MPSGILGRSNLSANTNTTLYTVPATKLTTLSVNFCNRNNNSTVVRLAVADIGTPTDSDWLIFDVVVLGSSVLERTGLVLDASKRLIAYSSLSNVSVIAYGYEE